MPRISILIPVYNVEKYLSKCIESVLKQDFQDWEMILVDDGSSDRSGIICDEYATQDCRIKVVHKENGGLISARREGVISSSGTYLVFLDSDDTLTDGALSFLYDSIVKGYDIVKGSIVKTDKDDNILSYENFSFSDGEIIGREDIIKKIFIGDVAPYLCGAIYKRELFTEGIFNISIDLNISFGEDWITNLLISKNVQKMLCVKDIVYNYYVNNESITNSQVVSLEYYNRFNVVLKQSGIIDIPFLQDMVKARECSIYIKTFFVPEFKFDVGIYKKIYPLLKQNDIDVILKRKLNIKFFRFIDSLPLYYLYSRLYCLLFFFFRLRGKRRKILK